MKRDDAPQADALRLRLDSHLRWLATAKESLPAIDNSTIRSDRMLAMSGLIDRMQRAALAVARRHDQGAAVTVAAADARRAA